MSQKIRIVQVGLGPIGNKITRYLARRGGFQIVGAVDVDPSKQGRDIGELAGIDGVGVRVVSDVRIYRELKPEAIVLTTSSSLPVVKNQILEAVEAGVNVVSTCEELAYPWVTQPEISAEIDAAAKSRGVSVLGTGVNPGFMMDFLPMAVTGLCLDVSQVTVERVQNAARRRLPFQKKIGAGLTPEQFAAKVEEGTLRHVGLTESIHLIAARLGWELDKTEDLIRPVLAEKAVSVGELSVRPGQAVGVSQHGRGVMGGKEVISLIFRATVGEPESYDRIHIQGIPEIEVKIPGGVNGDIATCAITVNAVPSVIEAAPGLRTMADIAPVSCFNASGSIQDAQ